MTNPAQSTRAALERLRRAADIYQATVRPVLLSDTPDARRIFERNRALHNELLDALGEAHDALDQKQPGSEDR